MEMSMTRNCEIDSGGGGCFLAGLFPSQQLHSFVIIAYRRQHSGVMGAGSLKAAEYEGLMGGNSLRFHRRRNDT